MQQITTDPKGGGQAQRGCFSESGGADADVADTSLTWALGAPAASTHSRKKALIALWSHALANIDIETGDEAAVSRSSQNSLDEVGSKGGRVVPFMKPGTH